MTERDGLSRRSSSKSNQGSTCDDLSLPSPRTPIFDNDQTFEIPERSCSDSHLEVLAQNLDSSLNVCGRQFKLGSSGKIKVTWNIVEESGSDDWIGLFPTGKKLTLTGFQTM